MTKVPLVLVSLVVACGNLDAGDPGTAEHTSDDMVDHLGLTTATRAKAPDSLWKSLGAQPKSFIVALSTTDKAQWRNDKASLLGIAPTRDSALARRATDDSASQIERDWEELPLVQVRAASVDGARALLARADVEAAYEIENYEVSDAESFPLIGQPTAASAGYVGAGTSVAVLDTGTDYTRTDFGSCTEPGVPASCRVAYAQDFATNDNSRDDNGHGTNVAGIVAGTAPGTKILALDVFNGSGASSTDVLSAINWAIANKQTYNIAALNLSLGGGSAKAPCTNDAIGAGLAQARNAGIAPVVASGNNGYTDAISSPACAPAAISVGAVYDANLGGLSYSNCTDAKTASDQIACFSNSASFLTLLAPGALITAGGYTMAGTSQATPHVAGALAVLRAAFPAETVDQLVARLTSTGKSIKDARNNVTKPRIDLAAAVGATSVDREAPKGSVTINGGAAVTKSASVSLAITGSDPSGVAKMCVTNASTCTAYEAFAATKTWTLTAGDGAKTVMVYLRDAAGNTTTASTSPVATIKLDATAPSNGTVTVTPNNGELEARWSGFADAGTGVASYRLAIVAGATAPANCAGEPIYAGTASSTTVRGLTNGTTYSLRVCALDGAGNVSTGATASGAPRAEANPPVGSIKIANGATTTKTRAVSVSLPATDDTKVASMCLSEATTCTSFVAYAATASFTFPADGARTLRAWFRDSWGNTSAPVSASIVVDTVAPTGGVVTAVPSPSKITVSWTPALDTGSGLAGYKLVGARGTLAPAAGCTTGTELAGGAAMSFAHAVDAKSTWSYRLCATDKAGNTSAGTVKTVTAL